MTSSWLVLCPISSSSPTDSPGIPLLLWLDEGCALAPNQNHHWQSSSARDHRWHGRAEEGGVGVGYEEQKPQDQFKSRPHSVYRFKMDYPVVVCLKLNLLQPEGNVCYSSLNSITTHYHSFLIVVGHLSRGDRHSSRTLEGDIATKDKEMQEEGTYHCDWIHWIDNCK